MLVKNKKKLHKSSTVILSIVLATLAVLEIVNQSIGLLSPILPSDMYPWVSFGLAVAIGVGRYIKQQSIKPKEDEGVDDDTSVDSNDIKE